MNKFKMSPIFGRANQTCRNILDDILQVGLQKFVKPINVLLNNKKCLLPNNNINLVLEKVLEGIVVWQEILVRSKNQIGKKRD